LRDVTGRSPEKAGVGRSIPSLATISFNSLEMRAQNLRAIANTRQFRPMTCAASSAINYRYTLFPIRHNPSSFERLIHPENAKRRFNYCFTESARRKY